LVAHQGLVWLGSVPSLNDQPPLGTSFDVVYRPIIIHCSIPRLPILQHELTRDKPQRAKVTKRAHTTPVCFDDLSRFQEGEAKLAQRAGCAGRRAERIEPPRPKIEKKSSIGDDIPF